MWLNRVAAAACAGAGTAALAVAAVWDGQPSVLGGTSAAACEAAAPPQPQAVPLHAPRATAVSLAELRRWLEQRGADLSGVEVGRSEQDAGGRFGVFASPEGQRRTALGWWGWLKSWVGLGGGVAVLASFPLASTLTAASVASSAGGQSGPALAELLELGVADERTLVILHLAVERLRGRHSPLSAWISMLPSAFSTPLFWSEDDLLWLRGTNLYKATTLRKRSLQEAWRRLEPVCKQLALEADAAAPPTFADFLWAYSIFWSRAVTFPCPAPPGSAAAGVTMQEGIVPGLDFCNHAAGSPCRWTVFGGGKRQGPPTDIRLVCPSGAGLCQGQEVTINYGDKSNEELLFLYGFVEEDNSHDVLMVACPLPPPAEWDATLQARVELLRLRGLAPQIFLPRSELKDVQGGTQGARRGRRTQAPGSAVFDADLPVGTVETLEVFVMEPRTLAQELEVAYAGEGEGTSRAGGSVAGGGQLGMSDMERSGLRMALLTTLVRLLELKVLELEGTESGSGPLQADLQLLHSGTQLTAPQAAALKYRSGQKRLAREYLVRANALLGLEMRHLQGLGASL